MAGYFESHNSEKMANNTRLDTTFKRTISQMKPHASKLARNSIERHQVTLWVKKLLGLKSQRRERNDYAQLLLGMLEMGRVTAPFLSPPPSGALQALGRASFTPRGGRPNELEELLQSNPDEGSEVFDFGLPGSILSSSSHARAVRSNTTSEDFLQQSSSAGTGFSGMHSSPAASNPLTRGVVQRPSSCNTGSKWSSGWGRDVLATAPLEAELDPQFAPPLMERSLTGRSTHKRHSNLGIPLSLASDDITDHTPLRPASPLSLSDELEGVGFTNEEADDLSDVGELLQGTSRTPVTPPAKGVRFASGSLPPQRESAPKQSLDQEEIVRAQQSHEVSLRKILNRKNDEIERLRCEGLARGRQLEARCRRLEQRLEQQSQLLLQQREETEAERDDSLRTLRQRLKEEYDQKLHKAFAGFESEKLELERRHSHSQAQLQEEASATLRRAREQHCTQATSTAQLVSEQQRRLGELEPLREGLAAAHAGLAQEKVALEQHSSALQSALAQAKNKVDELEAELDRERGEREGQLTRLRSQMEDAVHSMQLQHSGVRDKLNSVQRQLDDAGKKHQMELSELAEVHSRDRRQVEALHKQELSTLTNKQQGQRQLSHETEQRLEQQLRECEQRLLQLHSSQELHAHRAEHAIEEFKSQVEAQTSEMFERMQRQLKQLETELAQSRSQRQHEAREHSRTVQQLTQSHHKELAEVKAGRESDAALLNRQHQREVESLKREADKDKAVAVGQLRQKLEEQVGELQRARSSLEVKVHQLGQQLLQEGERHSVELTLARDSAAKEMEHSLRIQESAISKLRSQLDSQRARLSEEHRKEIKALTEKHGSRLQQLEHSMAMRTAESTESLSSLQAEVHFLKEELERERHSHTAKLAELVHRHGKETASLKQHHQSLHQDLLHDNESARSTVLQLGKRVEQAQVEGDAKLSHIKLQYENRMKGMMPFALKQELEDTIKSLRAQVSLLTQRASILQDEVDRHYPHTITTTTSQPHNLTSSHPHTLPASTSPLNRTVKFSII